MQRVTEPELMDDEDQAHAYSAADFTEPHERFVALCREACGPLRGFILDLGCGPADVTVRLAKANQGAIFHGVDGSEAMLRFGAERIAKEGLQERITLVRAFLPRDPIPRDSYDAIVSNSLLHHLHDPSTLWSTVKRYARRGAPIFVMDLMRPPSLEDVDRLVELYARGEPEVLRRDFRASLCAAFTVGEVRSQLDAAAMSQLRVEAVSDRHLAISGTM